LAKSGNWHYVNWHYAKGQEIFLLSSTLLSLFISRVCEYKGINVSGQVCQSLNNSNKIAVSAWCWWRCKYASNSGWWRCTTTTQYTCWKLIALAHQHRLGPKLTYVNLGSIHSARHLVRANSTRPSVGTNLAWPSVKDNLTCFLVRDDLTWPLMMLTQLNLQLERLGMTFDLAWLSSPFCPAWLSTSFLSVQVGSAVSTWPLTLDYLDWPLAWVDSDQTSTFKPI